MKFTHTHAVGYMHIYTLTYYTHIYTLTYYTHIYTLTYYSFLVATKSTNTAQSSWNLEFCEAPPRTEVLG